jgi:hypothetical protein
MDKTIGQRIVRFFPTELAFGEDVVGERDKQVLRGIVEAALGRVADLPVNTEALFPIEEMMENWR